MVIILVFIWWVIGVFVWIDVIREEQNLRVQHLPQVIFMAFVWPVWYAATVWYWLHNLNLSKRVLLRRKVSR